MIYVINRQSYKLNTVAQVKTQTSSSYLYDYFKNA